jgi:magnesium transporter
MILCYSWNRTTKTIQCLEPEFLEKHPERLQNPDEVVWIDLANPTKEEEELAFRKIKPIHPLSLEDITRPRREPDGQPHFPKVEEFPDYLFVIVNPLTRRYRQELGRVHEAGVTSGFFTQLSAILTRTTLVTHHYEPLDCIDQVMAFLGRHRTMVDRGPDYIFHLLLDNTVDEFAPVLDYIDQSMDELELQVLEKPTRELFNRLVRLKREVILLRKTLIYEREILVRLARGEFDLVEERETVYYRNVYDHLVRFAELIDSSRDLITDLMQSYLAASSNKLNEVMKALAMISTTILPMSLIASIYGMNFENMPEMKVWWGYPLALVLMLLAGVGSWWFFRWRKWF